MYIIYIHILIYISIRTPVIVNEIDDKKNNSNLLDKKNDSKVLEAPLNPFAAFSGFNPIIPNSNSNPFGGFSGLVQGVNLSMDICVHTCQHIYICVIYVYMYIWFNPIILNSNSNPFGGFSGLVEGVNMYVFEVINKYMCTCEHIYVCVIYV
jgi:hypothetical protein